MTEEINYRVYTNGLIVVCPLFNVLASLISHYADLLTDEPTYPVKIYNQRRPHTALKYKTPDEVHQAFKLKMCQPILGPVNSKVSQ